MSLGSPVGLKRVSPALVFEELPNDVDYEIRTPVFSTLSGAGVTHVPVYPRTTELEDRDEVQLTTPYRSSRIPPSAMSPSRSPLAYIRTTPQALAQRALAEAEYAVEVARDAKLVADIEAIRASSSPLSSPMRSYLSPSLRSPLRSSLYYPQSEIGTPLPSSAVRNVLLGSPSLTTSQYSSPSRVSRARSPLIEYAQVTTPPASPAVRSALRRVSPPPEYRAPSPPRNYLTPLEPIHSARSPLKGSGQLREYVDSRIATDLHLSAVKSRAQRKLGDDPGTPYSFESGREGSASPLPETPPRQD